MPDHNFPIAPGHKFTPSVYKVLTADPSTMLSTYNGPTFIAVRSCKHDGTSAQSHAIDFATMADSPTFAPYLRTGPSIHDPVKPVLIILCDGGPDQNPRFQKTLATSWATFRHYNLDYIVICCNAAGRSAFNPVERTMAPLSRKLSGVILPHDTYGTHLTDGGVTIDENLELKNFNHAGGTLAQLWSTMTIGNYPVSVVLFSLQTSTVVG